jgi:hypothetical protein
MYPTSPVAALPGTRHISAFRIHHERLRNPRDGINVMASGLWLPTMPELTESTISAILGGLLLFGILIGWPAITTVLGLVRSRQLLGRLYWRLIVALDTASGRREPRR